jgi:hypothetical protein
MSSDTSSDSLAFQGIKRKLGVHQETLSRALHRLERDGFIEKSGNSYRLSVKGQALALNAPSAPIDLRNASLNYSFRILSAVLPQEPPVSELAEALEHKWFGNLRWYGSSQLDDDHIALTWITQDGSQKMIARFGGGTLTIESESRPASNSSDAVKDAYELFEHIMKTLRELGSPRPRAATAA